jgi:hypothetical protein
VDRGRDGAAAGARLVGYGIALLAAAVFFLLLYRVLPNAGQRLRDVWPGALVAALLFVLAGQIFPLYLRWTGSANRFGAAFGLVWLLVTWLAAFAHLRLVGAYVNARRATARAPRERSTAVLGHGGSGPTRRHWRRQIGPGAISLREARHAERSPAATWCRDARQPTSPLAVSEGVYEVPRVAKRRSIVAPNAAQILASLVTGSASWSLLRRR